jgi:hypothetical protein
MWREWIVKADHQHLLHLPLDFELHSVRSFWQFVNLRTSVINSWVLHKPMLNYVVAHSKIILMLVITIYIWQYMSFSGFSRFTDGDTEQDWMERPTNIESVIDRIHGITYWYARRDLGSTDEWARNWICLKLRQVKTVTGKVAIAPTEESSAEDVAVCKLPRVYSKTNMRVSAIISYRRCNLTTTHHSACKWSLLPQFSCWLRYRTRLNGGHHSQSIA